MKVQLQKIAVANLVPAESNVRTVDPNDPEVIELSDSIREFGLLQPLVARKIAGGKFEIIAGHRRFMAAQMADLKQLDVIVRTDKGDLSLHHLVENVMRQDLRVCEMAAGVEQALKAKTKAKDVAKALGQSETWVSKVRSVAKAISECTHADGTFKHGRPPQWDALMGYSLEAAYEAAQAILNPAKAEKKAKAKQPTKDQEEGAQNDDAGEPAEVEFIQAMRAKIAKAYGFESVPDRVQVVPVGKSSWEVRLSFKTDHQLEKFAEPVVGT